MKETTLYLRVCVYMTTRSWTNVWHATFTKYTQMSVLQCGGCSNTFMCQLWETLFACILIAITRNLSGNRSQTPISSYKNTPRVWVCSSNIPPTCVFWNLHDTHCSRSAKCWQITFVRLYVSQQPTGEQKRSVPLSVQVCVSMLLCGLKICAYSGRRLPSTSPWETPLNHHYSRLLTCRWSKLLAGIGVCSQASVPVDAHICKWSVAIFQ